MPAESPPVWKTLSGVSLTIFLGCFFFILTSLNTSRPLGEIICWIVAISSFTILVLSLIYGIFLIRINDSISTSKKILESVATKNEQQLIKEEVENAAKIIKDTYRLATKELLNITNSIGLEMVYPIRSDVEHLLKNKIQHAKHKVKFLGISLTTISRIAEFKEILEMQAKKQVRFQFLFLKRETSLYQQRTKDENYPQDNIGDLISTTIRNIDVLNLKQARFE